MRARSRVPALAVAKLGVVAIATLVLVAPLVCLRPAVARADASAVEASIDLRFAHLRSFPDVEHAAADETDGRPLPEAKVPVGNAENFLGVGLGLELAMHDRVRVPLLSFALSSAIGASPRVYGTVDGSIVEVDTWRTGLMVVGLPGYGVRIKDRRWMFEAALQPGIAYLFTSGYVANGVYRSATAYHAGSFVLQVDLAACRRIDPVERACLFAAPALYEFGWFNAWTVGLRWEVGP
jgi:hypothetical protein